MTLRLLQTASLLALVCAPVLLRAQAETTGKEEERLEALARSQGEWAAPKSKLTVGFRVLSSGGKVNFGNLGIVAPTVTVAPASDGIVTRGYHNGKVTADSLRTDEKDVNGNQTSTPGGRYQVFSTNTTPVVDADGNVIGYETKTVQTGDLLSYTPGMTRTWVATSQAQIDEPGYVSFSIYSTTSDGGNFSHKQGPSGGVEFQLARDLGRAHGRFQWSLTTGIALNDINSKSAGSVSSTLHTSTDYYAYTVMGGVPITLSNVTNPFNVPFYDSNGNIVSTNGLELTVPLSAVPDASKSTSTDLRGGATVNGKWQVKGAYMMVKVGPSLHTQITNHFGVTASLGLAGGYAGTRYSASESFTPASLPDVVLTLANPEDGSEVISSTAAKFVTGYYADLNLEWSANDTVGLFTGVTTQKLSSYEQKLGDRVAKVDIGSSVGLRGGISVRF